ncbi:transglycosylase SLT domain-containing protein [Peribacillus acanthi]|uniref:aggregation-promoting factor C-terminal-like domain-containing protein n=1 Tax=Peribacillus acanthi TaxID=2171554 RepID=UPI000D3EACA0|nr:transglycosylase SLT domain-containing protein [Peribacillus acanthi]
MATMNDFIRNEVIRKAKAGEKMDSTTPEKQALYDQYAKAAPKPVTTKPVVTPPSTPTYKAPTYTKPVVSQPTPTSQPKQANASAGYGYGVGFGNAGQPKGYTDRNEEINRTESVIQNRVNSGMDLTHQLSHYKNLTGKDYVIPQKSNGTQNPSTWTPPNLAPKADNPVSNYHTWVKDPGSDIHRYVNDEQELRSINPLYDVNNQRQGSILDALKTGNWQGYDNFQAKQAPMHYNTGADGNAVKNKDYYKQYIESTMDAIKEAKTPQEKASWENRLKEWVTDFNNAPVGASGGIPYIVGMNGVGQSNNYGIPQASDSWMNSNYNNPNVWTNGYEQPRMWYDNPVFQDNPELGMRVLDAQEQFLQGDALAAARNINDPYLAALMNYAQGGGQYQTANAPQSGGGTGTPTGNAPTGGTGTAPSSGGFPTSSPSGGFSYQDALKQVQGQVDPLYQRAVEALKGQKYQNELDASQVASARGLSHSGLAADQLNKIAIATQGNLADMEAERAAKISQLAQAVLERQQDVDFRNKQFDWSVFTDGRNFDYQKGRDGVMDGRWQSEFEYGKNRDSINDQWRNKEWDYQTGRDAIDDARYADETKYKRDYQSNRDAIDDYWRKREYDASRYDRAKDVEWRKITFNNMSASDKAQMDWTIKKYGEDKAWDLFALEYQGELAKGQSQAELDYYKSGFNGVGEGGGYKNNYKTTGQSGKSSSFKTYQTHLNEAIKLGVPSSWATSLTELVGRESSWNPKADNPKSTAYGYGQFIKDTRAAYEKKTGLDYDNPVHQLVMMAQYVKDKYKTPDKALAFWDANHWY